VVCQLAIKRICYVIYHASNKVEASFVVSFSPTCIAPYHGRTWLLFMQLHVPRDVTFSERCASPGTVTRCRPTRYLPAEPTVSRAKWPTRSVGLSARSSDRSARCPRPCPGRPHRGAGARAELAAPRRAGPATRRQRSDHPGVVPTESDSQGPSSRPVYTCIWFARRWLITGDKPFVRRSVAATCTIISLSLSLFLSFPACLWLNLKATDLLQCTDTSSVRHRSVSFYILWFNSQYCRQLVVFVKACSAGRYADNSNEQRRTGEKMNI